MAPEKVDQQRLERLLGQPALQRLLERLRYKLEHGRADEQITLQGVSTEERQAVADLLGRPAGRGRTLRVAPRRVEQVLREAGVAQDLVAAVTALTGPLRDVPAERARARSAWDAVFDEAMARAQALGLAPWLASLRETGVLKRLAHGQPARARGHLDHALRVAEALPGAGQTRSTLAASLLGDAHGLDPGRPVAALVRRAIVERFGGTGLDEAAEETAVWAGAGILVGGGVTSTVLTLNLTAWSPDAPARILSAYAETGEPVWLTLRQLVGAVPAWAVSGAAVYVCENPSVVAEAADRHGARGRPLVCLAGQPGAAAVTLLRQLAAAGATLHYHGDFDWPGIRIAHRVIERFGARPWRLDAETYERYVTEQAPALTGEPAEVSWDPALGAAMRTHGRRVDEELMLDELLEDLGGCKPCSEDKVKS